MSDVIVRLKARGYGASTRSASAEPPIEWRLSSVPHESGEPMAAAIIFDGDVRGMYTCNAVVQLARECGWAGEDEREDVLAAGDGEPVLINTASHAEDFLNTLVPDGYSFGWLEGSFYLADQAWWQEEEG